MCELAHEDRVDSMSQIDEIWITKKVTTSGNSCVINVTKEIKALGLNPGDIVTIVIRKPGNK